MSEYFYFNLKCVCRYEWVVCVEELGLKDIRCPKCNAKRFQVLERNTENSPITS